MGLSVGRAAMSTGAVGPQRAIEALGVGARLVHLPSAGLVLPAGLAQLTAPLSPASTHQLSLFKSPPSRSWPLGDLGQVLGGGPTEESSPDQLRISSDRHS